MGFFDRMRIRSQLQKGKIKPNMTELIGGNVILIIGSIILGYGLASFQAADFTLGSTFAIGGGTMLFVGILLSIRTLVEVTNALGNALKAVEKVTDYIEDVEKKTFGSKDRNYHSMNSLQKQVENVSKNLKNVIEELRQKGFKFYGLSW